MLYNNLCALMVLKVADLAILLLTSLLPSIGRITNWTSLLLSACIVWLLFQMAAATNRYCKAAVLTCVALAGSLFTALTGSGAFTMILSILSILARYQEFQGHSEICQEKELSRAGKWERLFWWEMGIGLVGGFLMSAGVVIGVLVNTDAKLLTTVILLLNTLLSVGIGLVYLDMLKKTAALYRTDAN